MLTARVEIINQWNKEEINGQEIEFETIGELENFLSYNRAYIYKLSFKGMFKKSDD